MRQTMFRVNTVFLLGATLLAVSGQAAARLPGADSLVHRTDYLPGEVLVKYRHSRTKTASRQVAKSLGAVEKAHFPNIGVSELRLPQGLSVHEAIRQLRASGEVEFAEPNYLRFRNAVSANDPDYPVQWALDNTGQDIPYSGVGTVDADMDVNDAWTQGTDTSDVRIAVVDDGFDLGHPDFAGTGYDNFNTTLGMAFDSSGNPAGSPKAMNDNQTHGTYVSGCIGAVGNNGTGVAGITWKADILPLKVSDSSGNLSTAAIVSAVTYAVDHGAGIINISLGGPSYSQSEYDALDYARQHNVLVVVSAGNADSNNDRAGAAYPADYDLDNIVSVAASTNTDDIALFSQWGSFGVDLAAPGVGVRTTKATVNRGSGDTTADTAYVDGTSFSSPYTAGVAALVAHKLGTGNFGYEDLRAHLFAGAELAGTNGGGSLAGRTAAGRVNANKALDAVSRGVILARGITVHDDPAVDDPSGNNNGEADPGETFNLDVALENMGPAESNVAATLSLADASDTRASVVNGSDTITTIGADADPTAATPDRNDNRATAHFTVKMGDITDNEQILFKLELALDNGTGPVQTRYFYLESGTLEENVEIVQDFSRTDWDEFQAFHFDAPAGLKNIVFETRTGGTTDIDLLARYSAPPEYLISLNADPESQNSFFFVGPDSPNPPKVSGRYDGKETIVYKQPQAGTYHVVAVNFSAHPLTYRIKALTDATLFNFASANYSVKEDAGTVTLTVNKEGVDNGAVSINYSTYVDPNDSNGATYKNFSTTQGTLSWAAGDNSPKTFTVPVKSDPTSSADTVFHVLLSTPTGRAAPGETKDATVTVQDTTGSGSSGSGSTTGGTSSGGGGGGAGGPLLLLGLLAVALHSRKRQA
jgi:MYXO-CTERM domain-containing protein